MRAGRFISMVLALLAGGLLAACAPAEENGPVVLAASSMQEALGAAAQGWTAQGHAAPVISFASSAAVARQVDEGAPADIVITSDDRWMDWLAQRGALAGQARALVGNTLVVVAPADAAGPASLAGFAADAGAGRLAIGEPDSVPAGGFTREALQAMGLWDALAPRVVPGENVRAALALVERGEAALGVVYASDAHASQRVRVVQRIEPRMHAPIVYYAARTATSRHADAAPFLDYLTRGEGQALVVAEGFALP